MNSILDKKGIDSKAWIMRFVATIEYHYNIVYKIRKAKIIKIEKLQIDAFDIWSKKGTVYDQRRSKRTANDWGGE